MTLLNYIRVVAIYRDYQIIAVDDIISAILENINRAVVINPVSLLSIILLATPKHTLDEEICIKQRNIYHMFLQKSQSFYQEIYG